MAYNLPAAWDPGFVMPKNVRDEGIERRAFITKMMPRGTYDDPEVGTGGYKVPRYVTDEGYGQGTFTTKWQPSGSYNGPKVPHWLNRRPAVVQQRPMPGGGKVVTVQSLGDDQPLPALYEDYGTKAAGIILQQISRIPAAKRGEALKAYLGKLDKSLWSRTQTIWNRYIGQGMPPADALPAALARAIAAGLAAEIVDMGLRRSAPQVNSLLGLGCYSRNAALGALGATSAAPGTSIYTATPPPPETFDVSGGGMPVYHGVRPKRLLMVGGFGFDPDTIKTWGAPGGDSRVSTPGVLVTNQGLLNQAQVNFLRSQLASTTDASGLTDRMVVYKTNSAQTGFPEPDADAWFSRLGLGPAMPLRMHALWYLRTGMQPLAWTTHPSTGERLAMHVRLYRANPTIDWNATTNPLVLKAWLSKVPDESFWLSVIHTVASLPATLAEIDPTGLTQDSLDVLRETGEGYIAVHNAINDLLSDLTCKILQSPAGEMAGAGAAAYVGAPPQAGVQGARMGAQACGGGAPVPQPVAPHKSILPLVLVAGGAFLTVALLAGQKRKKKP